MPDQMMIYCRRCSNETKHAILCAETERSDPEYGLLERTYHLAQCAGCDTYCYATATVTEDTWDPRLEEMVPELDVYPVPEGEREPLETYFLLPTRVRNIYMEVIKSINGELVLLPAIGLRALVEAICVDQNVPEGNLKRLINGLPDEGVLASRQSEVLHGLRELGNAVAHEIAMPTREEVLAALEIAEVVLQAVYFVPRLSDDVKTGSQKPS